MTGSILDGRSINCREDAQETRRGRSSEPRDSHEARLGRRESTATPQRPLSQSPRSTRAVPKAQQVEAPSAAEAWKTKTWSRVPGSDDHTLSRLDEQQVLDLIAERDAARAKRDFSTADALLDELAMLRVYVDDARRQRVWWVGKRIEEEGGRGRGSTSSPSRRSWFRGGEDTAGSNDGWSR